MQRFQKFASPDEGPLKMTRKNLNGSSAIEPVIGHDANWPDRQIVWSSSWILRLVQFSPSMDPWWNISQRFRLCVRVSEAIMEERVEEKGLPEKPRTSCMSRSHLASHCNNCTSAAKAEREDNEPNNNRNFEFFMRITFASTLQTNKKQVEA